MIQKNLIYKNLKKAWEYDSSIEEITYTPMVPKNYRFTTEQSDDESDTNQYHHRNENWGHGLRPSQIVDYSTAALSDAISTSDELSLTAALKSAEKYFSQELITEEIKTRSENENWTSKDKWPPNIRFCHRWLF